MLSMNRVKFLTECEVSLVESAMSYISSANLLITQRLIAEVGEEAAVGELLICRGILESANVILSTLR